MAYKLLASALCVVLLAASPAPSPSPSASPSADAAAQGLFAQGDFDDAAAAYAALLQENAGDLAAQIGLGAIELYRNDLDGAMPLLQDAVAQDSSNRRALGLLREAERRIEESRRKVTIAGAETDVPFVTADPLPVVTATVDGKVGSFVVDTGATLMLSTSFAQSLGLKPEAAGTGTFAGGEHAALQASQIGWIALGGATAYDLRVLVMPLPFAQLFPHVAIDGVIGNTLFERFLATIDYPRHRLILRLRAKSASDALLADARKQNGTVEPCWLVGDHFVMASAQVNDAPQALFFFDSGLAGGGIMPSPGLLAAAKLKLDTASAGSGLGGAGAVRAVPFVAGRIVVGTAVQNNVPGIFTPRGNPFGVFPFAVGGIISDAFLRHYAYTVDFDSMNLILTP